MSKRMKMLIGALSVVGGLGLVGALVVPALAQEPTPPVPGFDVPHGGHGWGRGFGLGFGFGPRGWADFDAVAEALGLTPEALFSELHSGKTLAEIAEAQGVDLEQVFDALRQAREETMKEAIRQAVEEGEMSQDQADWLLEGLEKGYLGGARGRGFRRGFLRGGCPWGESAPEIPSATPGSPS